MRDSLESLTIEIDRLVDGELGAEETAALVRRLDNEPDGWRRCSLAFLEAQVLGKELQDLLPDDPGEDHGAPIVESPQSPAKGTRLIPPRSVRFRPTVTLSLVMVLCAFGLGWCLSSSLEQSHQPGDSTMRDPTEIAAGAGNNPDSVTEAGPDNSLTDSDERPGSSAEPVVGQLTGSDDKLQVAIETSVTRVINRQDAVDLIPTWLATRIRNDGYQLSENRQVLSVRFASGQQLAIPVRSLSVQYVGEAIY